MLAVDGCGAMVMLSYLTLHGFMARVSVLLARTRNLKYGLVSSLQTIFTHFK